MVDEYQILTTEEIIELLNEGYKIELPEVQVDDKYLQNFSEEDKKHLVRGQKNEIVSIEYVGEEEVQCILVDDVDHLYLTDDFIPTHNTSNIVFLKSTDDAMLDTLEKMSGKRHQTHADSKMITKDVERIFMKNEGKQSITMNTTEEPVISYNDMAFISERNSIVFRAGDSPIWNRNEMILPMSWRLFSNKIEQPGKDYTLQTIPTLSSALDFDVRKNQPDFGKMLEKRVNQAVTVPQAEEDFAKAFGYTEYEVEQLDPDTYANNVMDIVNGRIAIEMKNNEIEVDQSAIDSEYDFPTSSEGSYKPVLFESAEENVEQKQLNAQLMKQEEMSSEPRFAGNLLSPNDLAPHGTPNHQFDGQIAQVFNKYRDYILNDSHFTKRGHNLYSSDGMTEFILKTNETENLQKIQTEAAKRGNRVFSENNNVSEADLKPSGTFFITDAFIRWLAKQDSWKGIADGRFERGMKDALGG